MITIMTSKKVFKYFLVLLVTLALAYFLYKNFHTIINTWDIFRAGAITWVIVALAFETLAYYFYVLMQQQAFITTSVRRRVSEMLTLMLSATVINVITPTADTAAFLLYANDAKRRKEPVTNIVAGVMLATIVSFSSFSVILISTDTYLYLLRELTLYEIVASILFLGLTGLYIYLIYLGMKKRPTLKHVLTLFNGFIYRVKKVFIRSTERSPSWVEEIDKEIEEVAVAITNNRRNIINSVAYSLLFHSTTILMLACVFLAFGQHFKLGILISGYAISFLFMIISPVPQGIGVVESTMSLTYASLGIPLVNAVAIAILFRGICFWLPLGAGFISLQRYNLKNRTNP